MWLNCPQRSVFNQVPASKFLSVEAESGSKAQRVENPGAWHAVQVLPAQIL